MKYLSLDIETTGLDPQTCQILQIAGIIEDTKKLLPRNECPQFNLFVKHRVYQGEAYALNLNAWILDKISKNSFEPGEILVNPEEVCNHIYFFCRDNGLFENKKDEKILVAGKNFSGFDNRFIRRLSRVINLEFHHRTLDPATPFTDWDNDLLPPSLEECLIRAGIPKSVTHKADDDAWDIIQVLRTQYKRSWK